MDFEIIWTDRAVADFEAAIQYVASISVFEAEQVRLDLLNSVELLARFPYIGPLYERDRKGRTREIVCHRYRIFYRVTDKAKRVEVLTIWHGTRNEPRLRG